MLTVGLALLGLAVIAGPPPQHFFDAPSVDAAANTAINAAAAAAGCMHWRSWRSWLVNPAQRTGLALTSGSFAWLRFLNAIAWVAHLGEAAVAFCTALGPRYRLPLSAAIGWAALTLACGYAALGPLQSLHKRSPVVRGASGRPSYMDRAKPFSQQQASAPADGSGGGDVGRGGAGTRKKDK